MRKDTKSRCTRFLRMNGWKYDPFNNGRGSGYYLKEDLFAIEVTLDGIVLLDDTGDFLHLPLNYYALIGVLLEYRQLPINYKSTK